MPESEPGRTLRRTPAPPPGRRFPRPHPGTGRRLLRAGAALLTAALPGTLAAQTGTDGAAPSRRLRVEVGALAGLGGDLLGAWAPARGLFLHAAMPRGPGEIHARLEGVRHPAREGAHGDLDEVRALAGAAWPLDLTGPLVLRLGGEVGVDYFRLPRDDNALETEVMAGLAAELAWHPAGGWRASAGVRRRWTFTDPVLRRDALTVSVGRELRLGARVARALGGALPPSPSPTDPRAPGAASTPDGAMAVPGLPPGPLASPRWAPLLAEVPGWATTTVDGVTMGMAPPGSPAVDASRVAVRVDGWEVPLELLGVTAVERLPVEPGPLASVVARPGAAVARPGRDAVLDVATSRPPPGWSGRVDALGANASGDGGPRVLVVGEGPNVESLEWGLGGGGAWVSDALVVRGEGSVRRRWVSETPVFFRHFEAVDTDVRWPWVEVRRGRASVDAATGAVRHRAVLAASGMDDFVLLPGQVREVPARAGLVDGWIQGGMDTGPWSLAWGAGHAVATLEATSNRLGRALDWREGTTRGRFGVRRGAGGLALVLERREVAAGAPLADPVDGHARLEVDAAFGPGPLRVETAASALRDDGAWGGSASAALVARRGAWAAGVRLSGEVAPPGVVGGLWRQEPRGLGLTERWTGEPVGGAGDVPTLRRSTAEAWHRRSGAAGWIELRARVDRGSGWWLTRAPAAEVDRVPKPRGAPEVLTVEGTLGWVGVRYAWEVAGMEGWGDHAVRGVLDGDAALEEAGEALPRHRSVHHLRWRLLPDLALETRFEARSGTRYADFAAAGPLFPAELPGGAWIDVGAWKAFLDGRADVQVAVRDALDREARTHPLAGTPGLTLEVQGRLRLGAQPPAPPSSSASRLR